MQFKIAIVSALAGLASAYYQPNTSKPPSGNAITRPLNEIVPGGMPFEINWTPSTPGKVSILLLKGPATNVKYLATIADSTDNSGHYTWNVDPSLAPQDSGYAIEIVAQDGTYQYSSQIGIGKAAGGSVSASTSFGSVETAPPSSSAEGTAVCGALDECASSTSFGSVETAPPSSSAEGTAVCGALDECASSTGAVTGAATGTGNISSPIVSPTAPITKPTSLATVAAPNGPTTIASTAVVGVGASNAAGSGSAPKATTISSAFAAPGAQLSGFAAVAAGLLGLLAL